MKGDSRATRTRARPGVRQKSLTTEKSLEGGSPKKKAGIKEGRAKEGVYLSNGLSKEK